jgi:hypothetical protein
MISSSFDNSAKTLIPNKITFASTGGKNLNISFGGKIQLPVHTTLNIIQLKL